MGVPIRTAGSAMGVPIPNNGCPYSETRWVSQSGLAGASRWDPVPDMSLAGGVFGKRTPPTQSISEQDRLARFPDWTCHARSSGSAPVRTSHLHLRYAGRGGRRYRSVCGWRRSISHALDQPEAERCRRPVPLCHRRRPHRRRAARGLSGPAMPKINLLEPAFVVSVGDLIEGYTEDQARLDSEWDEFERFIGELESPFFYAAGNHDMSNAVMAETWQRRFGPSYYRFVYKNVSVPGPQLRAVRNGQRPGVGRTRTMDAGGATRLHRADHGRAPGSTLDDRDHSPTPVGLRERRSRRLAAGGRNAGRSGLHGVRRTLPPVRQAHPQRPQVHHPGHHRRHQQFCAVRSTESSTISPGSP